MKFSIYTLTWALLFGGKLFPVMPLKAPSYNDNIALKTKEEYLLYMVLLSICRLSAAISPLSLPQLLQHWALAVGQGYTTVRSVSETCLTSGTVHIMEDCDCVSME